MSLYFICLVTCLFTVCNLFTSQYIYLLLPVYTCTHHSMSISIPVISSLSITVYILICIPVYKCFNYLYPFLTLLHKNITFFTFYYYSPGDQLSVAYHSIIFYFFIYDILDSYILSAALFYV